MLEKPTKMSRYMAGRLRLLELSLSSFLLPPLECRKNKRQIRRIKLATESKKNSWLQQEEVEGGGEESNSVPPCATRVNVQVSSKRFALLLLLLHRFPFPSFLALLYA